MRVKLGQRGTVTIPKELRSGLDENTFLEAVRRSDGVIELRPQRVIDASQAWFWSDAGKLWSTRQTRTLRTVASRPSTTSKSF